MGKRLANQRFMLMMRGGGGGAADTARSSRNKTENGANEERPNPKQISLYTDSEKPKRANTDNVLR